ncbi:MAG: sigma-70 family RNA polymerase sigma factor [Sulfurifustaceae bacterium]
MTEHPQHRRFEDLFLPHLDAAYQLARWLVGNPQDAEDLTQEAYLRAFKFFVTFNGTSPRAWLLAIVRNTCYTWMKERRREKLHASFEEEEARSAEMQSATMRERDAVYGSPESIFAREEVAQLLNLAIEKLPLPFREIIVLRELEELSYREIAVVLSIPIGTVMSRIARSRRMLGEYLKGMSEESWNGMQRSV